MARSFVIVLVFVVVAAIVAVLLVSNSLFATTVETVQHVVHHYEYRHKETLEEAMQRFNFTTIEQFMASSRNRLPPSLVEPYLRVLEPFLAEEPAAALQVTQRPEKEKLAEPVNCRAERFASVFSGEHRAKPARVIDMVMFAYELDVLEMRWYELNDVVDEFVLVESTVTQRLARKQLMFASNRARFAAFDSKIIHMVMDDSAVQKYMKQQGLSSRDQSKTEDWHWESEPRNEMLRRYSDAYGFTDAANTLVIHGDMDEVPTGDAIHHFKHCELKNSVEPVLLEAIMFRFSFAWMPPGDPRLGQVLTIQSAASALSIGIGRDRHRSKLSGCAVHLNRFGPAVLQLYKDLALTEGGIAPRGDIDNLKRPWLLQEKYVDRGERICCSEPKHVHIDLRTSPHSALVPWVVQHNRERFELYLRGT